MALKTQPTHYRAWSGIIFKKNHWRTSRSTSYPTVWSNIVLGCDSMLQHWWRLTREEGGSQWVVAAEDKKSIWLGDFTDKRRKLPDNPWFHGEQQYRGGTCEASQRQHRSSVLMKEKLMDCRQWWGTTKRFIVKQLWLSSVPLPTLTGDDVQAEVKRSNHRFDYSSSKALKPKA